MGDHPIVVISSIITQSWLIKKLMTLNGVWMREATTVFSSTVTVFFSHHFGPFCTVSPHLRGRLNARPKEVILSWRASETKRQIASSYSYYTQRCVRTPPSPSNLCVCVCVWVWLAISDEITQPSLGPIIHNFFLSFLH